MSCGLLSEHNDHIMGESTAESWNHACSGQQVYDWCHSFLELPYNTQCMTVWCCRHALTFNSESFLQAANARAGQFVFVNVPSVSWWEFHPVSIAAVQPSSDGHSHDVFLHIKAYGSWSQVYFKYHLSVQKPGNWSVEHFSKLRYATLVDGKACLAGSKLEASQGTYMLLLLLMWVVACFAGAYRIVKNLVAGEHAICSE